MNECSVDGCSKGTHAKGMCGAHYQRLRLGLPIVPVIRRYREGQLDRNAVFLSKVSTSLGCWEWLGRHSTEGYGVLNLGGRQQYAHRLSYEIHVGPIRDGLMIDHKCHNRGCVNPDHLQQVDNKRNHENRPGPPANNTSGVRGVSWNKKRKKYEAYVTHWGTRRRLGCFQTLDEAEQAVVSARNELFSNNLADRRRSDV